MRIRRQTPTLPRERAALARDFIYALSVLVAATPGGYL